MSHILLKPLKMVALHSVVCVVGRGCILVPDAVAGMQGATWHGTRAPFSAGSRAINRWEVSDPLLCGLDGRPVVHRMISRTGGQNKDFFLLVRKIVAQAREGTVADAALRLDCLCCGVAGNSTASDSSLCCAERCCGSSRLSRGMVDLGCFQHCSDCVCILCWCT